MTVIVTAPTPWAWAGAQAPALVDYSEHGRAIQTVRIADGATMPAVYDILAVGCGYVRVEAVDGRNASLCVWSDVDVDDPCMVSRWRLVPVGDDAHLAPM